jgi:hypothetical protein
LKSSFESFFKKSIVAAPELFALLSKFSRLDLFPILMLKFIFNKIICKTKIIKHMLIKYLISII